MLWTLTRRWEHDLRNTATARCYPCDIYDSHHGLRNPVQQFIIRRPAKTATIFSWHAHININSINDHDDAEAELHYFLTMASNSIVSGNSATTNPEVYNEGGTLNDNGGNQIGISGINLAPLANYGGTMQTMVPLPGSPAICSAATANAPGLTTDQRGYPVDANCSAGAMDSGAVQTNYALSFSTEPPSSVYLNQAISPAPVVQLTESGSLATAASGTVSMTDLDTLLTGTTSASLGSGLATFSNLVIPSLTGSDTLTASMVLNPALSLNLSAASSTFAVAEPQVQVTVGTSPAGLTFSIDGTPYTSAQTVTWTATSNHTIAITTPQTGTGVSYAFSGWSDSGALSHTVTASLSTTSYTASFNSSYQLNIAANNSSYAAVTPATGTLYAQGAVVSISATSAAGYYFTGWSGSADVASASSANTTITMNAPETVTANFAPIPNFVVTVATDDAGTASNCTAQAAAGSGADSSCSLRDAVLQAAATTSGNISFDSTAFASAQTITLSNGTLTVPTLTTITGPTTGSGATLANLVTVSGNRATTVFTVNSGVTASMSGLNISGAVASGGGGISNSGTLTVTGCTISGNNASNQGAGIFNSGTLTVSNSTVSGNQSAGGQGGGIYNSGTATVTNSTFSANTGFNGGAIYNHGVLNLINDTLSANIAFGAGGGIYTDATLTLADTIVAGNSGPAYADMDGLFTDNGGNQAGIDPSGTSTIAINLAPLANFGGPTQTMIPQPGSPAICAGTSANATGLAGDQRGFTFDPNCPSGAVDSGAVQSNYALTFSTEPPANVAVGKAISPAAVVQLTESGAPASAATNSVSMADSASLLAGTDSENFASGSATFGNLLVSQQTSNDTLTATLALNPALSLNITATSTAVTASKTTPIITWANPAPITYGTALDTTQLNATTTVAGAFVYTPSLGTVLGAGSQTLSVTFTPTDTTDYTSATTTVQLTVNQATPSISWSTPSPITYGAALSGTQLNATSPLAGSFAYTPASGTVLGASSQMLSALFTPTDATDYTTATANVQLTVNQATPSITWNQPAPIPYGTALSGIQLNATANVPGAFLYTPASGTVLNPGPQTLSTTFTPTDTTNYSQANANVSITIDQQASLTAPAASSTLPGASVTFSWTAGGGVTAYDLWLGTAGVNSNNVYNSGSISATSVTLSNVPTNGVQLYARLWSLINGVWQPADYVFTEAGTPAKAVLTTPAPGNVLSGPNVTFQWTTGAGPTQYELWLSGIGVGLSDVYNSGQITATQVSVSNLPTNGVKLYARLWSRINGNWQSNDYTFTESGSPVLAALTSPAPSSVLSGSSAMFQWTAGGGPTQYELWLGTTGPGSTNVYNTQNVTSTSVTVNTLPTNGVLLYARLWSLVSGVWKSVDYTYTEAGTPALAALTTPAPSSVMSGSSATFEWTPGSGPTQFELWLGTTGPGSSNIYNTQNVTSTSVTVNTLPTNGVKLYARLWSKINGNWQSVDYTYTEAGTPSLAALTTPTPSTVLSGSSATFQWTPGSGPTQYELWLGTTGPGSLNVYTTNNVTSTSVAVNTLPTNGAVLYARLWSLINGAWQSVDYTYTEAGTPAKAVLTGPTPSSVLSGSSVNFQWNPGSGPTAYELWLSAVGVGLSEVYNSGQISGTSVTVNTVPTNGVNLYVRLYSKIDGAWQSNDYIYTEAGTPAQAVLTSPTPGTRLSGSSATFTWNPGSGATAYQLWLGTGVNTSNYYNSGSITSTTVNVTGLPVDGSKIHAQLWSKINGNWVSTSYNYTAQ